MIKLSDSEAEALADRLTSLGDGELTVSVTRAQRDAAGALEEQPLIEIEAVGPDRPGVVRDLSGAMVALGVSIDELATATEDASMAGGRVFEAVALLRLPDGVSADDALGAARDAIPDFIVDEVVER